jgi:hypothetical protein
MLKRFRRWRLKRRARRIWLRYTAELDKYDCGQALAEHISPQLATMRFEVEGILTELGFRD